MIKILLFLLCLLMTPRLLASPPLYEASLPVPDQSEASKRDAVQKALSNLLVKTSGNPKILSHQVVQTSLSRAHDYLQSYRYSNEKKRDSLQKWIHITFNKEEVDDILQRATAQPPKLTKSTKPEPRLIEKTKEIKPSIVTKPTLVWLAIKDTAQSEPELIEYEKGHPIGKLLELTAKEKHVPILLPELDVENLLLATGENIWQLDKAQIAQVSARYTNTHLLAGRLLKQPDGWAGQWLFKRNMGEWSERSTTGETPEANLTQAITWIQAQAGGDPTALPAESEFFLIQIHQISDLDKSATVIQYLSQLAGVKHVETVSIQPDSVILEIQAEGGKPTFQALNF